MPPTKEVDATSRRVATRPKFAVVVEVVDTALRQRGHETVISQAQVLGIGRTHWFDLRSGRCHIGMLTAQRMADALGLPIESFTRQVSDA